MRPAVERTVAAFGDPLAVLRDLGSAGAKAVAGCRQRGIPDLVCHFHFLAAVGRQLLDADYAALRSQITRSKLRASLRDPLRATRPAGPGQAPRVGLRADLPALLLWLLEGEGRKDLPYPFALPQRDFYRRCKQFPQELERRLPLPRTRSERRVLRTVSAALASLERMVLLGRAAAQLERRWEVFLELRRSCACGTRNCPAEPASYPPRGAHPPLRRPGWKRLPATSRPTASFSASASPRNARAGPVRRACCRKRSSCAIWTATATICSGIRWSGTAPAGCWRSSTAPPTSPSTSSPPPNRICAAAWDGRIWAATWKISLRRSPWQRTCGTRTTCGSCAARSTHCRERLPHWTVRASPQPHPCNATTGMPRFVSGTVRGRMTIPNTCL